MYLGSECDRVEVSLQFLSKASHAYHALPMYLYLAFREVGIYCLFALLSPSFYLSLAGGWHAFSL